MSKILTNYWFSSESPGPGGTGTSGTIGEESWITIFELASMKSKKYGKRVKTYLPLIGQPICPYDAIPISISRGFSGSVSSVITTGPPASPWKYVLLNGIKLY